MTAPPSLLSRLASATWLLADIAQHLADAETLTEVAAGLKLDGFPRHARRAGDLATRKRQQADRALTEITNRK